MKNKFLRHFSICIITVLAMLSILSGCRKSSEQLRAEREARERAKKEKELMGERAAKEAREKYLLGREKGLSRKYKEAIDILDEAERLDDKIRLEVQLFRNRMAEDMLKVAAEMMEDGIIDNAEKILQMLESKRRFGKYLGRTAEAKKTLEWYKKGYDKLAAAQQCISSYKTADAIVLLREVVKEYAKTLLADKAAALLRPLEQ